MTNSGISDPRLPPPLLTPEAREIIRDYQNADNRTLHPRSDRMKILADSFGLAKGEDIIRSRVSIYGQND